MINDIYCQLITYSKYIKKKIFLFKRINAHLKYQPTCKLVYIFYLTVFNAFVLYQQVGKKSGLLSLIINENAQQDPWDSTHR